jgi:formylglycine-generating enzyme
MTSRLPFSTAFVSLALLALACGGNEPLRGEAPPPPPPPPPPPVEFVPKSTAPAVTSVPRAEATPASPCREGMKFVDTTHCPNGKSRCVRDEYDKPNHITICHEFAPGQRCGGKERRQRFCIDEYEYPNKKGAHPPVMVSWYDAAGLCEAEGKRLCWESEWVSACEGPDKTPFPYGHKRDPAKCNIDNPYIKPYLDRVYAAKPEIAGPELLRLDQSVASGDREGCVSGFGVRDLTGNVDEWVNAEKTYEKSKWAGLKGGAWGHVRNACRPMTVSHPPDFTYYFISFRCCADAAPDPEASKDPALWRPPPQPRPAHPQGKPSPGWTPAARGPNRPK